MCDVCYEYNTAHLREYEYLRYYSYSYGAATFLLQKRDKMRVEDRVIPARFLVTLGHLIGILMVFKTKSDNVYAGLSYDPTIAEVDTAKDDVNAALAVALVCFVLDFISIFFGFSIFMMKVNMLQTVAHFAGAILVAHFISEEWDYRSLWQIVGWCNVPTALVEVGVLFAVFYLKAVVY